MFINVIYLINTEYITLRISTYQLYIISTIFIQKNTIISFVLERIKNYIRDSK